MNEDDPLPLAGPDRPGFLTRTVRIEPGRCRRYLASDWRDCLVLIESGEVEMQALSGALRTFHPGDMLWLAGLPLRCLVNRGTVPVVIRAVRRR